MLGYWLTYSYPILGASQLQRDSITIFYDDQSDNCMSKIESYRLRFEKKTTEDKFILKTLDTRNKRMYAFNLPTAVNNSVMFVAFFAEVSM